MISHKHRFIFVHIAKTGGCSIESVFGVGPVFANPEQPEDARHMKLGKYKRLFPEVFGDYFKFAFVRNPWDRVVSRYHKQRVGRAQELKILDDDMPARALADDRKQNKKLARLEPKRARIAQNAYLKSFGDWLASGQKPSVGNQLYEDSVDMEPYFDFVGRFETLAGDFQTVCQRIGLEAQLPHVNRSAHAHYVTYYDDRSRALVAELCAHDIERFGYRFGD